MTENRKSPTEELIEAMKAAGASQDDNDDTRFLDKNGTVVGYADGAYLNNGTCNEKFD